MKCLKTVQPGRLETAEAPDVFSAAELQAFRYARYSAVWAVLYLWGVGSLLAIYFSARSLARYSLLPTRSKVLAIFGLVVGSFGLLSTLAAYFG